MPTPPQNPQQVSPYLTHKLGPQFYDRVQLGRPFELVVDQNGLNDIFSRHSWPLKLDGLSVSMPLMVFKPDKITLMAEIEWEGFTVVISVAAAPQIDTAGLNLNIQSVSVGALPVTPVAQAVANQAARENLPEGLDPDDMTAVMIYSILANRPFDPIFTIAGQRIRATALTLEEGQVKLLLTPLD